METVDLESSTGMGPCGHCYDGSACLPGGCGIDDCSQCGKPCPYCHGTCEIPADGSELVKELTNGNG